LNIFHICHCIACTGAVGIGVWFVNLAAKH
jgi:hypothetical protein